MKQHPITVLLAQAQQKGTPSVKHPFEPSCHDSNLVILGIKLIDKNCSLMKLFVLL